MFEGGEIVSTFMAPESVKYGRCDLIEEIMIGEDTLLRFSGVPLGQHFFKAFLNQISFFLYLVYFT